MLRATHVASVSRQDCRALFAKLSDVEHQLEPCDDGRRAAVRLKRDSNTVPKCPAAAGRGEHQASRGPWVVGGDVGRWGRAGWRTRGRCVAHTRAMRGVGQGTGWSTRGCSPRGRAGSVWVGRVACSLAHARFLDPFASKGVPGLSRRGGETRGARGWRRQRRRGGPRRRGRGDGGGARVWTATTRAVRRSARVGRRRGGGEGGGARGGYRWRWAAVEKGGDREGGGGH